MTNNVNTGITMFTNEKFGSIRVVMHEGEPWFVAKYVCECLELNNVTEALRNLDEDEKITLSNPEGNPRAGIPLTFNAVSEAGLYSLVFRSRKPDAKDFRRWVTHEVLPAIRKTGSYSTTPALPDFSDPVAAARAWADEYEAKRKALQTVKDQQCLIDDQADRLGIGKNYKAVTAFPWLNEYFSNTNVQTCSRIGKAISNMCRMRGYAWTNVEDSRWGTVKGYHVDAIEEFRQLLDTHPEMMADIRKK